MAEPLRILHCMRAPVGGLFRHVLDLAAEQADRGHAVGIVADANASDSLTAQKFKAIEPKLTLGLLLTPMSRPPGLGDFAAARTVAAHARPLNLHVLHGHGAKGGAYARLASKLIGARGVIPPKSFYTPHGGTLNFKPGTLEARIYLGIEKALARYTTGIVFESDFARRAFEARVGLRGVAARVVPNGLQPADFAIHHPNADAADVLFIGELRDIKGVDVLLRALRRLNDKTPTSAVIVGAGPDADSLKALTTELGLAEHVRFAGALPARQALPLGRCLVVPSLKESFPYVVLEAAAAAIPLIATDAGGIPEIVAGTDTDLVAAGDDAALALAVQAVVSDPDTALGKAMRLRVAVERQFAVDVMAASILDFYVTAPTH